MRKSFFIILLSLFAAVGFAAISEPGSISEGKQPQISLDSKGTIRVVYGSGDKIFCSTSTDQGKTFSKPAFVAQVPNMHLGMTRGPQIASSTNYSIITAMDETGNIHSFQLNHKSKEWKGTGNVNDLKGFAPEGLMSIAADDKDNFYAIWLDIRTDKKNNIYFSSLTGTSNNWKKNILAYKSPDGHVCECCKPSIAVKDSKVALMFRNWLNGSRDLYLVQSADRGKTFTGAVKLGFGTWKLNGCPMDGGGLFIDSSNKVNTVWQREGTVYYCKEGEMENQIGTGRACSISGNGINSVICLQDKEGVKLISVKDKSEIALGKGAFLRSIVLPDNKILCVWEEDKQIKFKRI